MPYREPIFFEGGFYHVYSRGSEKRKIFLDRADRERFLKRFKEYKSKHAVSVICYCLMPNHYHLLLQQTSKEPISKFISRLNLAYAMYFNKRYDRVGPLFQGRFKAKNIDNDEYLVHLSRYIHLNPRGLIKGIDVENYQWSSLKNYISGDNEFIDINLVLSYFKKRGGLDEYLSFIKSEGEERLKGEIQDLLFEEVSPAQVRVLKRAGRE